MSTAGTAQTAISAGDAARPRPLRDWHARWRRLRLIAEIVYDEMVRDRLFTQAAALTYKTLFSLLPVFVLTLLILSKISSGDGKNALDVAVKQMLFDQLNINKMTVSDSSGHIVSMEDMANGIIGNARESITNPATGWVAFAVLLYGAVSLMIVIESTFNQMFGASKGRSWARRIMLYWCVLTLGPLGVGASIALGRSAYSRAAGITSVGWFLSLSNILSGFLISWLMIFLLYKLIPETRVKWRQAAAGSFLAAIAWEVGKWGFGLYMQRMLRTSWYGSMALLPLFMFWIYISWSVVLLGLELTYVQQYWKILKRKYLFVRAATAGIGGFGQHVMLSDVRWVFALAVLVCRRFKEGKTTGIEEAAETLMIPNDVTGAMMTALEKNGIVLCASERTGQYTLARPAESITAFDLITPVRALSQAPAELVKERGTEAAPSPALRDFEELETAWARKKTLADLAAPPPPAP